MQTETNEIENAYKNLVLYGQEVADFLLYVTGPHANNEKHWVERSKSMITYLKDKRSKALILGTILLKYNDSEYIFSDGLIYSESYLYAEYLNISRNTVNWLNAANFYLNT